MRCPYCGTDRDKVIDSRSSDGGRAIRRRRECLECTKRFTTYEHIEKHARMAVTKRDGSRVPYDRQKVLAGLEKACYKRPISTEAMHKLVDEVEENLFRQNEREIDALVIGRTVADRLKQVDHVAYVRFASVYKQFRDLDDFLDEVRDVLESSRSARPEQGELFKGRF